MLPPPAPPRSSPALYQSNFMFFLPPHSDKKIPLKAINNNKSHKKTKTEMKVKADKQKINKTKSSKIKQKQNKRFTIITLSLVFIGQLLLGMGLALEYSHYTQ